MSSLGKFFFPQRPNLFFPQTTGETWHYLEVNIQQITFLWPLEPQFDCQVCESLRIELECKAMPIKFMTYVTLEEKHIIFSHFT